MRNHSTDNLHFVAGAKNGDMITGKDGKIWTVEYAEGNNVFVSCNSIRAEVVLRITGREVTIKHTAPDWVFKSFGIVKPTTPKIETKAFQATAYRRPKIVRRPRAA